MVATRAAANFPEDSVMEASHLTAGAGQCLFYG
jgi:hypothetical protein